MEEKARFISLELTQRPARIAFWRDNGNGTCTCVQDGPTLTAQQIAVLPGRGRAKWSRMRWQ